MMLETGLLHAVNAAAMGLLDVPLGTILWDFLQTDLPNYTGQLISQLRMVIILAGLVIGFLVGLTGVGGGTLMTPLLILLGVRPTVAVGTDLLYASFTKLAGVQEHWKRDSIHWKWVLYLAMGSVPASLVATYILHTVASHYGSADKLVQWGLGVVLLLSAVLTLLNELYWKSQQAANDAGHFEPQEHPIKIILIGVAVGFMVGLTSLGSGSIVAVALIALSRLHATRIVGTNIAHGLVLLSAASVAHWQFGTVDIPLAANLLIGSLPGVILGSRMAYHMPARPLKVGMAMLVLAGGLRMFHVL
ncbi:MAG: sulfite exporter TauE/SafE family protein [Acidobacteria bacterium]|nr:sulfite exporter TauE/SafE family protein [Acidobacteriota bacterium]